MMMKLNLQYFGGRGSGGGKGSGGGGGKAVSFEVREGLGGNGQIIRTAGGDQIQVTGMSYMDRGVNRQNLKKSADVEEHFTEDFTLSGVGGKQYTVTREATVYKAGAKVKGGRFKSKIVSVKTK